MPAARPSKSAIQNVLDVMKANDMPPGDIIVDSDGGFTITQKSAIDTAPPPMGNGPKHFGSKR